MRCFVHKYCAQTCLTGIIRATDLTGTDWYPSSGCFSYLDAGRRATRHHAGSGMGRGERGEQLSWMSRGRRRRETPGGGMLHEGIEDGEQLVHTGGQGQLLGLASVAQALREGAYDRMVAAGDKGSHVEGAAYPSAATPDDAPPTQATALAIERGDADQSGDGLAVELPQFGQLRQQGEGRGRANTGDAAQQVLSFAPQRTALHPLPQRPLPLAQLLLQPGNVALQVRPQRGHGRVQALALCAQHADELAAARQQSCQLLG